MQRERYQAIVRGFQSRRVVVLGDLMLDEYLWGRATRISPESPVMVVDVDRETSVPGGAANVAMNLLALGAGVAVIGVVGDDAAGGALIDELREAGADVRGILVAEDRPTTRKTRVVAHSQQVMRVDREKTSKLSNGLSDRVASVLRELVQQADALLISDYNKGVLTSEVAEEAVRARSGGTLLTANPKPVNALLLSGADVVQLNQIEADALAGEGRFAEDAGLDTVGSELVRRLDVGTLVVTRGARGLLLWRREGGMCHIPPRPVEVYDAAGAGDTVICALTLGIAAGALTEEAAEVANHAASCVVRKVGVATVTQDELMKDWWENQDGS